jgi:hypothetical protein
VKLTAAKCQLSGNGNIPDSFDFIRTIKEFKPEFFDYKSDTESFDNESDTAVVFISDKVDSWDFFKAVYALKPDGFLFEKVPNGIIVYLAWDGTEDE